MYKGLLRVVRKDALSRENNYHSDKGIDWLFYHTSGLHHCGISDRFHTVEHGSVMTVSKVYHCSAFLRNDYVDSLARKNSFGYSNLKL